MFRLLFAVTLLLFFSCKKDKDLPDAPGDRLKMMRYKDGDSLWSRSFQYDVHGRLTAVVDSSQWYVFQRDINYDAQGNLLNIVVNGVVFIFDFDNEGRVIRKKNTLTSQQSASVVNSYAYDVEGRLILDSLYNYSTSGPFGFISFIYDDNNNVIETKMTSIGGSTQVMRRDTYDKQRNPLYGQSYIIYLLVSTYGVDTPVGKNNLFKERDPYGNESNFQYEYYSNGLPKRYTLNVSSSPKVFEMDYYYE